MELWKTKQPKIPKTDPIAVPCARAFATVNIACLPVAKLMAMVSPDQYAFSLLYIKPNSTASPRESEHLNAKTSLPLARLMFQLLHIILKLYVTGFFEFLDSSVFGLWPMFDMGSGFWGEGKPSWRSCIQDKKKKAEGAAWAGEMVLRAWRGLSKNFPVELGTVVEARGWEHLACSSLRLVFRVTRCKASPSSSSAMAVGKEVKEDKAISIPRNGISMACNLSPGSKQWGLKNLVQGLSHRMPSYSEWNMTYLNKRN